MAVATVIDGLVTVRVNTGVAGALETLGYTRNGAEIFEDVYDINVPSDENGGDEGPPVEIQRLGDVHHVRLELTRYDDAVATEIRSKRLGATEGTSATSGTALFANTLYFRLLLNPASARPRNYIGAVCRRCEETKGTKYSILVCEFDCYAISGTLFNTTTSG